MRKIEFEYVKGWNNSLKEIVEFKDDATEEYIQEEFSNWVWEQVGDYVSWCEVE